MPLSVSSACSERRTSTLAEAWLVDSDGSDGEAAACAGGKVRRARGGKKDKKGRGTGKALSSSGKDATGNSHGKDTGGKLKGKALWPEVGV